MILIVRAATPATAHAAEDDYPTPEDEDKDG